MLNQHNQQTGRVEINQKHLLNGYVKKDNLRKKFIVNFKDKSGNSFYFKENNMHSLDQTEIIINILRKSFGLQSHEMYPASFTDENGKVYHGTLSKDLIADKNKEKIVNASDIISSSARYLGNSVESHIINLENFKDLAYSEDNTYINIDNAINDQLVNECFFGFRSLDEDNFEHNYNYILKERQPDKYLNIPSYDLFLLPKIDNSQCALLNSIDLDYNVADIINTNEKMLKIVEVAKEKEYPFQLNYDMAQSNTFQTMLNSFKKEYNRNRYFKDFVNKTNNLNIREEILNGLKEYKNFTVDEKILNQVVCVFETTKELFFEHLNQNQQENKIELSM